MSRLQEIQQHLRTLADPERAAVHQRFFKTGPGEYGEGDRFLGIRVPVLRKLARAYRDLSLAETKKLLASSIHEERFLALLIMVLKYRAGNEDERTTIYRLYLDSTRYVNNWDLVDTTAEHVVGDYLRDRDRSVLRRLALSRSMWERRIAILATFHYIRRNSFDETLAIAEVLLDDPEDLIHKAVGWMLREVGKRDMKTEERFLRKHYKAMPRTMLRYAIEKFPEPLRQRYLKG
ncbi:MAG: DNA alkylation repair protein, partial [Chlorobi bacterium]|nr:DNA alkylation repair protein [Chlorobiota bacterium]